MPTTLHLSADAEWLERNESVRVIARSLDQAGNKLPFLFYPVTISISGPARLVGPDIVPMRGGSAGFWLTGTGMGMASVSVAHPRLGETSIELVSR